MASLRGKVRDWRLSSRAMLSFDAALARIIEIAHALPSERISVLEAQGRILAEDVDAEAPFPAANTSAMDGYALRAADCDGVGPFRLLVKGESRAGLPFAATLGAGACRIFTGALLPDEADTVVIQENVRRSDQYVEFDGPVERHQNVRLAGEDLAPGQRALARGTRLNPFHLGLLASLDRTSVVVSRRPRVAILSTGSELRSAGTPGPHGSIPESNSIAIRGLAGQVGATVTESRVVGDDLSQTSELVARLLEGCDLLVTIGGVSVGDYDVVKEALERAGVQLDFWKVAIKPGKPLTLGRAENVTTLSLPGNPVSAQVTFSLFGLPLLKRMMGARNLVPAPRTLRLAQALEQGTGRRVFHRVRIDGTQAVPLEGQSSGSIGSMAWADGLAIVSEDATGAAAGEMVSVIAFADL